MIHRKTKKYYSLNKKWKYAILSRNKSVSLLSMGETLSWQGKFKSDKNLKKTKTCSFDPVRISIFCLKDSFLWKKWQNVTNSLYFWVTFQEFYVPTFSTSGKKVLDPNEPYISMFQIKIRNVSLLVISEFCLSVICSASTVYTSLCRGLKY